MSNDIAPVYTIKETVVYFDDKHVYISDIFFDLAQGLSRKQVADKYGFERKLFRRVFLEVARFLAPLNPTGAVAEEAKNEARRKKGKKDD